VVTVEQYDHWKEDVEWVDEEDCQRPFFMSREWWTRKTQARSRMVAAANFSNLLVGLFGASFCRFVSHFSTFWPAFCQLVTPNSKLTPHHSIHVQQQFFPNLSSRTFQGQEKGAEKK
jgi:hypothetical protein